VALEQAIYDDRERRRARARGILRDGVILGLLIIGVSIWLGTSSGNSTATSGVTALGAGDLTTGILALIVVIIAIFSVLLALRNRVIARIGLRNVTRAKGRTAMLLFGLLIGSMIISSSLVIGDTVNTLSVHFTYISDGAVDEAVYAPNSVGGPALGPLSYHPLPASFWQIFASNATTIPDVAGVTGMVVASASVFDLTTDVAQPGVHLVGVSSASCNALGSFTSTSGSSICGPTTGEVLLNSAAAQELSANAGDSIRVSTGAGITLSLHVQAVVDSDTRGGFQDTGQGDIFTSVADAQNLTGAVGELDYIAVTNTGGLTGGPTHTDAVWGPLNASLLAASAVFRGQPPSGLAVNSILGSDIVSAEQSAQSLTQLFLVLGLFSIGAGCVLIVGIFAMLAEERRGEMGVARAIGTRRGQLIRAYYFEGMAYAAGAALLGTFLGVAVGWGIIAGFGALVGGAGGVTAQAIVQSFTFTPQSLVLAYAAGFLLTLGTVTCTSAYISRMNIVQAIRNQPELPRGQRSRRILGALGVVLLLLGLLLVRAGLAAGTDIDIGYFGVSLSILSLGLILSVVVPFRFAFSAAALGMIVFWADLSLRQSLFPGMHTGTIFVFFQEGIFLILAAVILYVFNSDLLVKLFALLSRGSARNLPVVRLAFSYPSQRKFNAAMTITIFAMVLFTITGIAVIGSGITAGVSGTVEAQSGGYSFFGVSTGNLNNLGSQVAANSTLSSEVSTLAPFFTGGAYVQTPHGGTFSYSLAAAPTGLPAWENFYSTNKFNFSATLGGLSPSAVWADLEQPNSTDVVVDGSFSTTLFGGLGGGPSHPGVTVGQQLNLSGPFPTAYSMTVVGVLAESTIPIILVNPQLMEYGMGFNSTQFFLMTAAPGVDPTTVIQHFQTHFFTYGLELFSFQAILSTVLDFTQSFITLLEIFVALGLVVGITALGILAMRAVVERRTHVGVVRAIGFRRSQVLGVFLTEYSFLALMGIGIGAAMGLVLAYNLYQGIGGVFSFAIPWTNLAIVLVVSYGLTLVATGIPSLRASRIPPAEAIRYSE
jgi:putative ABC transport system permease protein